MNQSELEANTCRRRQALENALRLKSRLVLVLLLIGRESGAKFFSQSQTVAMQNQSKLRNYFRHSIENRSIGKQMLPCKTTAEGVNLNSHTIIFCYRLKSQNHTTRLQNWLCGSDRLLAGSFFSVYVALTVTTQIQQTAFSVFKFLEI